MMNDLLEILESREGILVKHIKEDEGCANSTVLGQFFKGRIAVEERWLEETRKLIEFIKRMG